ERAAVDVLHDEVDLALPRGAQVIDGNRVRVAEAAGGQSLAPKAAEPMGDAAYLGPQHLDDHDVLQQRVPRPVDLTHAAPPDERLDLILAVEDAPDQDIAAARQRFAVARTEVHLVVGAHAALRAVFHLDARPRF